MTDDKDLQKIKNAMGSAKPTDFDKQKWKIALRQKQANRQPAYQPSVLIGAAARPAWVQLAVAASVGFIVGALIFSNLKSGDSESTHEDFLAADATIESVYTNL